MSIPKKRPSLAATPRRRLELAFAVLMPFVALALQSRIWGSFQPLPFVLFYPALVLSSWIGGRVGGGIALLLSIGFADWFFMAPLHSLAISAPADVARVLIFLVLGLTVICVHHRSRVRTEQYRNVTENIDDVVWVLDAETLRMLYVSPSILKQRGYTPTEIMALPIELALTPTLAERLRNFPAARTGAENSVTEEFVKARKDGSTVWTEVVMSRVTNSRTGKQEIHGVTRNISERKQAEERLRHMAQHDALTDLPNRVLFDEHVSAALAIARRKQTRFGLMFIDLDKFKEVNDTLGHRIGDLLLQEVSQRLRQAVRESDVPARIGGDEFVVLLRNLHHADDALLVGEKIRARLSAPFTIEGRTFTISASIGIAVYPDHGMDAIELARSADAAMYRAKEGGRDRVELLASAPLALH
jgi:diguanylate cyclase (GGDEF)-like protein/PAS domain S-box-containing protein